MTLYKKTIVIWADDANACEDAAQNAIVAARESGNIVAFGLGDPEAIQNPESDPHYSEILDDAFE
jgi:hypothetical protein